MKLFRIVSNAEKLDYDIFEFRTAINTLEAKQFFKSEIGVREFHRDSINQNYRPPYKFLFVIDIDEECFHGVPFDTQELDRHEAITVFEDDLPGFNQCINFIEQYDLRVDI